MFDMPPDCIEIMESIIVADCQLASDVAHNLDKENRARNNARDDRENTYNNHF